MKEAITIKQNKHWEERVAMNIKSIQPITKKIQHKAINQIVKYIMKAKNEPKFIHANKHSNIEHKIEK